MFGKHYAQLPGESDADYEAAVRADIQQSQQAIEPITGEKVNALSYPEGAYGTLTMDALRSQGIELTFTTQPGVNAVVQGLPQTLYSMHRITMTEDTDMENFVGKIGAMILYTAKTRLRTRNRVFQYQKRYYFNFYASCGSTHLIEFAEQIHKNRGRVPRFLSLRGRKFPEWELSDVRVLRSQNTDCRKNDSFSTVTRLRTRNRVFFCLFCAVTAHCTIHFRSPIAVDTPRTAHLTDFIQIERMRQHACVFAVSLLDKRAGFIRDEGRAVERQRGRLVLVILGRLDGLGADAVCRDHRHQVRCGMSLHAASPMRHAVTVKYRLAAYSCRIK